MSPACNDDANASSVIVTVIVVAALVNEAREQEE